MVSIKKLLLQNMLFITFISFTSLYFLWIHQEYETFREESASIKEKFIASEKERLEVQVQTVLEYIQYMRNQTVNRLQGSIKGRVNEACAIALNIYNENKDWKSGDEIKKMIKDALRPIRFNRSRGYYFAFNMEGIEELFADRPEMEGKSMLTVQGSKGEYVVPDMIEILKSRGEGFYSYTWSKPEELGAKHLKIAYVKYFEPYGWGIGTGEYVEDVEAEIQDEVLDRISSIRFKEEGYLFGSIYGGKPLFTNGKVTKGTESIWEMTDPKGVKIIQEQNRVAKKPGGGFVFYSWQKMESVKPAPKMSYVVNIPEWEWIIGAGVYLDEVDAGLLLKEKTLYQNFLKQAGLYFAGMVIISLLIFLWIRYQSHKIQSGIRLFLDFFETASMKATVIDPSSLQFEEFKDIAVPANRMIAKRTEAIQALRESEEKFRLVFFSSPDSINLNRAEDGVYLEINEGFTNIMGYSREEAIGTSSLDLNIWNEPKDRGRLLSELKKNGVVENMEAVFRGKKGETITGLISARVFKIENEDVILSIIRDITERKQMEADRERLLTAIEQSSDSIVITDTGGTMEYVNPSFEKISGYSKEDLIGQNPRILKSGEQDDSFYRRMWETIASGNTWSGKLTNKKKDGSFYIEKITISPVFDKSGKIINFVAVKRDITDDIKMEEKLQQSQKMEAIGTLAGGIAHDFNNILGAIIGYTEMAKDDCPKGSSIADDLDKVLGAGQRAAMLVKQILAFSHQDEAEHLLLQPSSIVKEAIAMLRPVLPATIEIIQDIDPETGLIFAEPGKIHQILMNLCTNAFHAMEENGGRLAVSLKEIDISREDLAREPHIKAGAFIQLSVCDSGTGMTAEVKDRVFDPYFTTKGVGRGTGMGLAIVHGLVKSYGGFITLKSEAGKGTAFHIFLPVANKAVLLDKEVIRQIPTGKEKILFIDDEDILADMGKAMLERLGYHVTVRKSSLEALETFQNQPDQFDLVFTDQTMPGMTGVDLARRMLQIRPDVPIILCTGYSSIISDEKAQSIGIKAFALKPLTKKDIARLIRKVLDGVA